MLLKLKKYIKVVLPTFVTMWKKRRRYHGLNGLDKKLQKYLKKDIVHTWIFGHTHVFRDFIFNNEQTRIISNADPKKKFFKKNFVININE